MNTTPPPIFSPVLALVDIDQIGRCWAVCFHQSGQWYWDHDGTPVVTAACAPCGPDVCEQAATVIGWVALPEIPNA